MRIFQSAGKWRRGRGEIGFYRLKYKVFNFYRRPESAMQYIGFANVLSVAAYLLLFAGGARRIVAGSLRFITESV
ncbi:hypothetical protein [Brenneria corticis]|uniref:hypothetical protein n=1 Tax=Brenneria corticis TaxID=2173106 RepID=UPI00109DE9F1|nr:hypothetical protein [Brenneria sp. CFCC 11842]